MFGREKEKEERKKVGVIAGFIGKGVAMEGRLIFEETMRVDGSFKGDISAPTGSLVVGDGGYIEGEISASTVIITGTVKGKVEAAERVELRAPGRMTGEIKTPTLIIDEGVLFEGTCTMVKKDGGAFETVEYGEASDTGRFVQ
ncbi:MAG: hypothetical protein A2V21_307060 [Deltaproteobacteria bacterium GWC2_55_46]|nr:MAG: hypothetical protein A2Z79_01150 [Deltaproteobacteria bacterium GWA2_55_82]OGQ62098.1 MAG: hypothetical protein A3I81_04050 [Deltaproteobacteria bacterium RIFCSPLOWO2_02_FULL_55_12]OIJ74042.1 MAG: hypothetical protein A2V21_307060 [Deltaproteobacteria bacterium GWC2_55_46]